MDQSKNSIEVLVDSKINYHAIRYYVRIGVGAAMVGIVAPDIFGLSKNAGNMIFIVGCIIFLIGIFKAVMTKSS